MIAIDYDFEGWPKYAHTLREILIALGAKVDENGNIVFNGDDELLDAYPYILEDDGMGYGVNERYATEIDKELWDNQIGDQEVKTFNIFADKVASEDRLKELQKEMEEIDRKLKEFKEKQGGILDDGKEK